MERALTVQAPGERECEIQTAGSDLKRFLTTGEGFHDFRILGDSSAFGRESDLAGTKPVFSFFFSPLLAVPIISDSLSALHLTLVPNLWPHQTNCNIFEVLTMCPYLICSVLKIQILALFIPRAPLLIFFLFNNLILV